MEDGFTYIFTCSILHSLPFLVTWVQHACVARTRVHGFFSAQDPVILSATPFIAYMTKASANIKDPRAWIYGQFACANIGNCSNSARFSGPG